jgi:MFS family permease
MALLDLPSRPDPRSSPDPRLVLVVGCWAQFLIVFDYSAINIALPSMGRDVGASEARLQLVVSAYALVFGALLLLGGRAADRFGRIPLLLSGLGAFAAGAVSAAFAHTDVLLICGRAIQGVGAALIVPSALSLITTRFGEGAARNRALGIYGFAFSGGFIAGPALGGALTELWSWRLVLAADAVLAIGALTLAATRAREAGPARERRRLDLAGAATAVGALLSLNAGLELARDGHWMAVDVAVMFVIAASLVTLFLKIEQQAHDPLAPPELLSRKTVIAAAAGVGLGAGSAGGLILVFNLNAQQVAGYSALEAGLVFTGFGFSAMLGGLVAPRLVRRVGLRAQLIGVLGVQAAGTALFGVLSGDERIVAIIVPITLVGFGHIASQIGFTIAGTSQVADQDQGLAGAIVNTASGIGTGFGVALMPAVMGTGAGGALLSGDRLVPGLHDASLAGVLVVAAAACSVALLLRE